MDKILFEIKITNSCEEIKRLEILNDILKNVGADASFEKEQSGENFLKIRYDKETIRKIKSVSLLIMNLNLFPLFLYNLIPLPAFCAPVSINTSNNTLKIDIATSTTLTFSAVIS